MRIVKSKINPEILKWWREQLNLDIDLAAKKLNFKVKTLEMWESWEDSPTMWQLEKVAKKYNTNLTVFYLPAPPENFKPKINYRGIEMTIEPEIRYNLEIHIWEAYQRKKIATELYSDLWIEPAWLLKLNMSMGVEKVAEMIREYLWPESRINSATFRGKEPNEITKFWKSIVEGKDILVSQTSSMNTHIWVPTSVMRGFCITWEGLPIIMLNSKDSPRGKVFTILHELTHILIGWESEIQNVDFRNLDDPNLDAEEIFCNKVSAEILVPRENLLPIINSASFHVTAENVNQMARGYWVSEEVIMRRLLDFNKISKKDYERFREENKKKWIPEKSNAKIIIPPYRKVISANWTLFTHITLLAYQNNKINLLNVGQFLGTKLDHLPKIENALYG